MFEKQAINKLVMAKGLKMNKVLPPKGSEVWSLTSPETPNDIKRIVQFSRDSITNTLYISNLGQSVIELTVNESKIILTPVEKYGSYVTSADFARKIWNQLIDAGYKVV
jgi:hypothetical protein